MKKFAIVLSLLCAMSFFGLQAKAQDANMSAPKGSAGVKMIWDYKKELEMSDGQVAGIKEAIENFQKQVLDLRQKLQATEGDIQELIQKKGDMDAIKAKLQTSAELQVQLRVLDIQTARKIDTILTPYQLNLWREIQQREVAKQQQASKPKKPAKPSDQ